MLGIEEQRLIEHDRRNNDTSQFSNTSSMSTILANNFVHNPSGRGGGGRKGRGGGRHRRNGRPGGGRGCDIPKFNVTLKKNYLCLFYISGLYKCGIGPIKNIYEENVFH